MRPLRCGVHEVVNDATERENRHNPRTAHEAIKPTLRRRID
jgi:hypothetical protein